MKKRCIAMLMIVCLLESLFVCPVKAKEANINIVTEQEKEVLNQVSSMESTQNESAYTIVVTDKSDYYSEDGNMEMHYVPKEKVSYTEALEKKNEKEQLSYAGVGAEQNFFKDCSTDYGFYQFDLETNAAELQTLYLRILDVMTAAYAGEEDIALTDFNGTEYYCMGKAEYGTLGLTNEEVFKVYISVLNDHPLLYYVHNTIVYDGMDVYLMMEESFVKGQKRKEISDKIEQAVTDVADLTEESSSNYEIAKIVHDKIIADASYAFAEDGITPKDNSYVHGIAGYVSDEREIVCDGYAKTFGAVLNYLDIENIFVTGWSVKSGAETSDETAHAWNIVRLGNEQYYFVDLTWNDIGEETPIEDYFCIGQELFNDHSLIKNGESANDSYMYGIPQIAESAFSGEDSLKMVDDPEYVILNKIDYELKDGVLIFSGRGSVILPDEYPDAEWSVYRDEVKELVFEEGITFIGNYAFMGFNKVERISFPDSLWGIGQQAFDGCTSLEEVTLPDYMTYYDAGMFENCTSLKEVKFGKGLGGVMIYTGGFFAYASQLEIIEVPEGHGVFTAIDNVLIDINGQLLQYPAGKKTENYNIPETVKTIFDRAFVGCDYLKNITIPESVEMVGTAAFCHCNNLEYIEFPASVKSFCLDESKEKEESIWGCDNLKYITNHSEVALPLGMLQACSLSDETKKWRCWKDSQSGEVVTSLAQGTVQPHYVGEYYVYSFVQDGIEYRLVDAKNPEENFFECVVSDIPVGTVKAVNVVTELGADYVLPKTIKHYGWVYEVEQSAPDLDLFLVEKECTMGLKDRKALRDNLMVASEKEPEFTWESSNPNVVSLDKDGVATAMAEGEVTITCTAKLVIANLENTKSITFKVVVGDKDSVDIQEETPTKNPNEISEQEEVYETAQSMEICESTVYNGKTQMPAITVKDSKGNIIDASNYTVTYSNNKNVGIATVIVKLQGKYRGTLMKNFEIKPKGTTLSKVSAKKKGFLVKWRKQKKQTTGYEIQYATKKNFKNASIKTINKNKTTTKEFLKLKANKKYYVRIRTYKNVKFNGITVRIYSDWSNMKSVKTRKK